MTPVTRAFDAVVDDVNKADRTLVAKINTAGVDRYHTVIDPKGIKFDNYRRNAVVLHEHGKDPRRFTDPVGRNVWIRHNGGSRPTNILARTKFLEDDFSQQRFEWYRDGIMNAFSVNILPVASRTGPPTREELRDFPEWEAASEIYREADLAEYSTTVVPGNADCLAERAGKMMELVARGLLWLPDDVRPIIEDRARAIADDARAIAAEGPTVDRRIVEEDGKFFVLSEDGDKRLGGPYGSRGEAEKRLEQVEYFKHNKPDGRSIVSIAQEVAADRRAMQRAIREEIVALVDLMVYGRV
jgi:Fe-S-cluster formation regulator IscX/YfhJ